MRRQDMKEGPDRYSGDSLLSWPCGQVSCFFEVAWAVRSRDGDVEEGKSRRMRKRPLSCEAWVQTQARPHGLVSTASESRGQGLAQDGARRWGWRRNCRAGYWHVRAPQPSPCPLDGGRVRIRVLRQLQRPGMRSQRVKEMLWCVSGVWHYTGNASWRCWAVHGGAMITPMLASFCPVADSESLGAREQLRVSVVGSRSRLAQARRFVPQSFHVACCRMPMQVSRTSGVRLTLTRSCSGWIQRATGTCLATPGPLKPTGL